MRVRAAQPSCVSVAGYGHGTDLHHLTQPHPNGMRPWRRCARPSPKRTAAAADIGYVMRTYPGTPLNDASEGAAYRGSIWRGWCHSPRAYQFHEGWRWSPLGAAGSIEALFAMAGVAVGTTPPAP